MYQAYTKRKNLQRRSWSCMPVLDAMQKKTARKQNAKKRPFLYHKILNYQRTTKASRQESNPTKSASDSKKRALKLHPIKLYCIFS